ncbi:MAG: hypothetical protein R3E96_03415 [Planctomycetota bacterium]
MENPHPVAGVDPILCTGCHGVNLMGRTPWRASRRHRRRSGTGNSRTPMPTLRFNKLTHTGLDRQPDYTVDGVTGLALDHLRL